MSNGQATTPRRLELEWDIDRIVSELRELRDASLAVRRRSAKPLKLPSCKSLAVIVESLGAALFPNRLGLRDLADESVDFFVGHTLDNALRDLALQIERELQFADPEEDNHNLLQRDAREIIHGFANQLPEIRRRLETDLHAVITGDPSARNVDEVLACYPGVTAITHYRIAHALHELGAPLVARTVTELAHSTTGVDIHPGAKIDESFFIDHGTGVVIGETAVIGRRVRLYHGVTLGAKSFSAEEFETAVRQPRHPIIEDDVVIYAGATLLGRITIGAGSTIGGNVWLTQSVPPKSIISQAKLQSEEFSAGSGI
ncbi:MAG: serine acetyltransferase [Pirellula sp.]|nr:serine acetyltransferase [Pirellula sp.]